MDDEPADGAGSGRLAGCRCCATRSPPTGGVLLRRAVLDLATTEHRRHVPAVAARRHARGPAIARCADDPAWDHGLRTDLVGAAAPCPATTRAWVWVTRSGPLALQDVDAAWLGPRWPRPPSAGSTLAFVVVTRHGWRDPRSGVGREWQRIRQR